MALYFSEKFRNLRKSSELTQEQIADVFHVSPQAVSRWETGATYPDIEILPSLADFFNVSVDDLLGVDIRKKEERMEELLDQMAGLYDRQWSAEATLDAEIEILRGSLEEFPNNLYLLQRLAGALYDKTWFLKVSGNNDEMRTYADESIKIYERIVNESKNYTSLPFLDREYGCTYERVRCGAMQGLAYTYNEVGETAKAVGWAKKLPSLCCTDQMVLSRILRGEKSEERANQIKRNISAYSKALESELKFFSECKYDDSNIPEKIKRFKEAATEINEYADKEA